MTRLTKGMYGAGTGKLFGLISGQMCAKALEYNVGWYNKRGEKLGYGDLSAANLQRIAGELEEGEAFLVFNEHRAHWAFAHESTAPKNVAGEKLDSESPGIEYVLKHAIYLVVPCKIYSISEMGGRPYVRDGVQFHCMAREKIKWLIN